MITLEYTSKRRMIWSSKYHKLLGQYYKQASDGKKVYTLHIFKNFKFTVTLSTLGSCASTFWECILRSYLSILNYQFQFHLEFSITENDEISAIHTSMIFDENWPTWSHITFWKMGIFANLKYQIMIGFYYVERTYLLFICVNFFLDCICIIRWQYFKLYNLLPLSFIKKDFTEFKKRFWCMTSHFF